ncbi:NADPH-dependent F420 reductase [Actinomadura rupiterrae]|uniref:NADPH-dependent F420 reductase n=1 Tax=Actinomadura rupiterrae TaxID=559627 RepID=UPI0020A495C5|nr:hypothetical protein [Actinomadura rupiterrae]
MRIGIIGTGNMAQTLGAAWARAGHDLAIAGRSPEKARALADTLADAPGAAVAVPVEEVAVGRDVVLVVVPWDAAEAMVAQARIPAGTAVIDATNAVAHGIGTLLIEPGESMAGRIAQAAPGAHVVKAFHTFPSYQWTQPPTGRAPIVVMSGDDPGALKAVGELARDLGGDPVVLGGSDRARQLEEVAGFIIELAVNGHDPSAAVPAA